MASLWSQPHSANSINISLRRRVSLHFRSLHRRSFSIPPNSAGSRPLKTYGNPQIINLRRLHQFSKSFNFFKVKSSPTFRLFCAALPAKVLAPESLQQDVESTFKRANKGRIYQETYGCQMNVNDMEIVLSIMKKDGYTEIVEAPENAEVIFINTCAIRDNAEQKVWQRLNYFWFLKREWKTNVANGRCTSLHPPKVVVLGCMAERLKEKILDAEKMVDVVCGPDAYRDLPRLLEEVEYGHKGINTLLSLEETYADISPVRISSNTISAFVSIMRGCNNMCSFCIVPFTRGRERSRRVESIVREVGELHEQGVKEVMLLGQNVNSYNDLSAVKDVEPGSSWELSEGFSNNCRVRNKGLRFSDLLDQLSMKFPEMRFRYTSPHPKDFPDELLYIMRDRYNICKNIHLPAQTGSTTVLQRMRRGYTREAYLDLVKKIRSIIPDVGISSDFICGFCGETEDEHADTLSLMKAVGYDNAYMFAYSLREKTHAHRNYADDVPENVKQRRLTEIIEAFRESKGQCFDSQIGTIQLILVEGPNKRHPETELTGKSDRGHRVSFPCMPLRHSSAADVELRKPVAGDFVEVRILKSTQASLSGEALARTSLSEFYGPGSSSSSDNALEVGAAGNL
ncbi:CDK5RAP1-like protein [Dendrobium catenatum]|uniref:CDK5RAP1-like protein n=1 Tax=Dendrobium catenatum TaxID=906689 RepID=A0A2I0W6R9_9ASPA|nr:CDK5RAP1-like protein [Dendrobium catenatum]PKU71352.1 CDK5RAP1-like protein [Dendrobium catenatum]